MITSEDGITQLEAREGVKLEMYRDQAGWSTIGVGHKLTQTELLTGVLLINGESVDWRDGITENQARSLLQKDLANAQRTVTAAVKVVLSQARYDCLVSFCFNVGGAAFTSSTLLRELNAGNYDAVPAQLALWIHSGGQVDPILEKRRASEIEQWNAGA